LHAPEVVPIAIVADRDVLDLDLDLAKTAVDCRRPGAGCVGAPDRRRPRLIRFYLTNDFCHLCAPLWPGITGRRICGSGSCRVSEQATVCFPSPGPCGSRTTRWLECRPPRHTRSRTEPSASATDPGTIHPPSASLFSFSAPSGVPP